MDFSFMTKLFKNLNYRSQLYYLRQLANRAVSNYPIKVKDIKFIQHGENTTFKIIDSNHKKYLLRIHRNGYHSDKAIGEELDWLLRIERKTNITAPRPIRNIKNKLITKVDLYPWNETRNVTFFRWVEGRQIEKSINESHVKMIAKLTYELHNNTQGLGVHFRNYWDAKGLAGSKPTVGPLKNLKGITVKEQQILNECRKLIYSKLIKYQKYCPEKMGLIHADLHFGNLFYHEGQINPIDFDDCGHGFHMYDLAVTSSSLAYGIEQNIITKKQFKDLNDTFLDSYYHLNQKDLEAIDTLKLARKLLGIQWLNTRDDNPLLVKKCVSYTKKTIKLLKKELKL